jgi:hypothetical protein
MSHLRRPAESSGQPAAAGREPGPLEVAEARRGETDDELRRALAGEAVRARAEGIAELGPQGLLEDPTLRLYRLLSGQYRHTITVAGNIPAGGRNVLRFPEEIRAGHIFIIRAIRCLGPPTSKLLIYADQDSPTNFREVLASAQENSAEPPGTQVIRGPSSLLAIFVNSTAEGLGMVRLEGDLVKREPVDT